MTTKPTTEKKRSLFHLEQDQQALVDLLTEIGGDVTDNDVAAAIDDWILEIAKNEQEKLDRYAQVIRRLELDAAVAEAERERYAQLRDVRKNAAQRLKEKLKHYLEEAGKPKVETQHHKFSVCKNGGKPSLLIPDISKLPEDYIEFVPQPKNDEIRKALEADPASVTGASLEPRGTHLRIT